MRSKPALAFVSIAVLALGACSSSTAASTAPAASAAPIAVTSLTPSAVPAGTPSPAASAGPSASEIASGPSPSPASTDPCDLLTRDEASTAVGVKLGAGVSSELNPDRVCTFKSGTTEVKIILAPPAPDAATAQAYWDAERGQVPAGVNVHDVTGFDRAAYGSGGVSGYSISALFVIHGTTFFDFYCGLKACTEAKSVEAAQLIVGRLP